MLSSIRRDPATQVVIDDSMNVCATWQLRQPGVPPPFRVPYLYPADDEEKPTDEEYQALFSKAIAFQTGETPASHKDQCEIWLKHCDGPRLTHLCCALLSQLFFGRLNLIIGVDLETMADNFLEFDEGKPYLTTAALSEYLVDWSVQVNEHFDAQDDEDERAEFVSAIQLTLEQTALILSHLSWFLEYTYNNFMSAPKPAMQVRTDEPLGMAHSACVVLHQALVQACGRVLGLSVRAGNSLSLRSELPWLKRRMQIEGWCPYTIWKLYNVGNVDELVYGYCLGTVRTQQDHSHCTIAECVANSTKVNESTPVHIKDVCHDGCNSVCAPFMKIVGIIKEGGVPLLQIGNSEGDRLGLSARRLQDEGTAYIAISHVWADGLGSSNTNTIRQCQLRRLADRLEVIREREQCGPLYIWVDTLCVPVGPTFQRQRDAQIQKMHEIYQKAYAVIVLDADTLTMKESDPFELIGMRLYMSAWASRLWTYQEGSLTDRLFVMTKEGYIDLDARIQAARARDPLYDNPSHNLVDATLRATIFGLGRSNSEPLLKTDNPQPTHPAADRASQIALHAMKDRSSSRPDSEALIIGSALGLNIQPILHAGPSDRMPALIKAMAHPPANLMFSTGPRLTQRGFRWAPRSILRSRGGYAANAVEDAVSLDSAQLDADERSPRLMCELHPEGEGLVSFNPGILLKWVRTRTWLRHLSRGGREQGVLRFEMMGYLYAFGGLDAAFDDQEANLERTNEVADLLREGKDLAILLPVFDPSLRLYIGALVEILGESRALRESASPRQDATRARFVMLVDFGADVSRLTDGPVEDVEIEREGWETVKMTGPTAKVLQGDGGKYEGEWMEPRFWLVD
ncbi:hypothetical protein LTR75_012264 [Friedmanniomyces endolithicus]|nr:hypothetical protein LTR75_012264 [Friedmanniomyces endolithicus]